MQRQPDILRRLRLEQQLRTLHGDLRLFAVQIMSQLGAHELGQRGAIPAGAHQQVVRIRQRLQPFAEPIEKAFDGSGMPGGLSRHRLDHGQQILGPVRQLAHEIAQVGLGGLAGGERRLQARRDVAELAGALLDARLEAAARILEIAQRRLMGLRRLAQPRVDLGQLPRGRKAHETRQQRPHQRHRGTGDRSRYALGETFETVDRMPEGDRVEQMDQAAGPDKGAE